MNDELKILGLMPCVPVFDFPDGPPEDLKGAIRMSCEECLEDVWMGPKKQEIYRIKKNDFSIICFPCWPKFMDRQFPKTKKEPMKIVLGDG